ncbi:MAG: glycosyltransferase [Chloroflexota bacterium]|nr:glycosyltransferase [Chloroflexota bacterium]MDE3192638.1 glycosyltransferase [Chloroflexota bacterium]
MSSSIGRLDRIALTHDYLDQYGGAERTLARICELFPSAPVHTSVYDRQVMRRLGFAEPAQPILVSFMQSLPLRGRVPRYYFTALYPAAFRSFDLSSFDVVLSSATFAAKALSLREDTVHVCYCYTPPRFLWGFDSDTAARGLPPHERPLAALARIVLRRIDRRSARRVDVFLASSGVVAERIRRVYGRDARVVHPPVETERFARRDRRDDGFLLAVSRLNAYKRLDDVVLACTRERVPLVVVGTGHWETHLRRIAGPTVRFMGPLPDPDVESLLSSCSAFVLPGEEDFGIAAVEAMAAGAPVIALRRGGAVETVVDGVTGVLYDDPSPEGFAAALARLRAQRLDPQASRARAALFHRARFSERLADAVVAAAERGRSRPN